MLPLLNALCFFFAMAVIYRVGLLKRSRLSKAQILDASAAFGCHPPVMSTWRVVRHCRSRLAEQAMPVLGISLLTLANATIYTGWVRSFSARVFPSWPSNYVQILVIVLLCIPGIILIRKPSRRLVRFVLDHAGGLCPKCMYDLRALMDREGRIDTCPECGLQFRGLSVPSIWVGMYYVPQIRVEDPNPTGRPWLDFLFRERDDG